MSNKVSALCGSVALNLCYFPFLAMDPIWIWADATTKSSALAMFWLKPIHSMWVTWCKKWGHMRAAKLHNWDKCDKAKSGPKVAPQIVEAAASRSCFVFHAWHIQHNIDLSKKSSEKVLRKCQSPCKWNQVEVRWTGRPELERRVAMSVMISKLKCIVHHETRHPECTSSPKVQYDETKDKQIGTTSTFQWTASVSIRFANSVAA